MTVKLGPAPTTGSYKDVSYKCISRLFNRIKNNNEHSHEFRCIYYYITTQHYLFTFFMIINKQLHINNITHSLTSIYNNRYFIKYLTTNQNLKKQ